MNIQKKLDSVAIAFSAVCAVHCFLTPFIIVLFPFCASSCCNEHSNFHQIMVYIVLPLSSLSLFLGCKHHKKTSPFIIGVLGLAIITYCAFWGHSTLGELNEKVFTTIGGSILAFAHLRNFQLCRCIRCDEEEKA
ncbi:MerC domain-containing protein [Candidatus Uabimicrobium sp. HlEnr_7]|uniref:MerC domain-containing protein n=1 Tax=Candidatus Uabimicrobium helgolandensis TaxID=3095367 RepID=UPI003556A66A